MIRLKHLSNVHCNIDDIYNNIGAVYRSFYHYDLPLDYFNRSIEIYNKSLSSSHLSVPSTCKNIGMTYEIKKDFIQALEFYTKAANMFHQTLPIKHPDSINSPRFFSNGYITTVLFPSTNNAESKNVDRDCSMVWGASASLCGYELSVSTPFTY